MINKIKSRIFSIHEQFNRKYPMILERIKEYIDYKGLSVAAFERSIGMANASFGKSLKNKGAIGTDKLEKILSTYPDLSPTWVMSGEGEMLKTKRTLSLQNTKTEVSEDKNNNNKPIEQTNIAEIVDKFLSIIKEKDEKILSQSDRITELTAEVSQMKEQIFQLEREKGKNASGARTSEIANAG